MMGGYGFPGYNADADVPPSYQDYTSLDQGYNQDAYSLPQHQHDPYSNVYSQSIPFGQPDVPSLLGDDEDHRSYSTHLPYGDYQHMTPGYASTQQPEGLYGSSSLGTSSWHDVHESSSSRRSHRHRESRLHSASPSNVSPSTYQHQNAATEDEPGSQDELMQLYHTNMGTRGTSSHSEEAQRTAGQPIPPPSYEYTLQAGTNVDCPRDAVSVYAMMSREQRLVVVEKIAQTRPLVLSRIQQFITKHLTADQAETLLREDNERADAVALQLIPTPNTIIRQHPAHTMNTWMTGLENWQKREVVRRLAEVTLQPSDKLREFLLQANITPEIALKVLAAQSVEEIWGLVQEHGLTFLPGEAVQTHHFKPWQKGLSNIQRLALRQRMAHYMNRDDRYCYQLLLTITENGGGLKMLKAEPHKFAEIMNGLIAEYGWE
ncbi:hypothetical protein CBS101457_000188 [Exobasidium rhododendri]|nr:hypothetical protein CBS101457_000188 [Exobasidium rhododendri]